MSSKVLSFLITAKDAASGVFRTAAQDVKTSMTQMGTASQHAQKSMGGMSGTARTLKGSLSASIVAMQMSKSIMGDVYRGTEGLMSVVLSSAAAFSVLFRVLGNVSPLGRLLTVIGAVAGVFSGFKQKTADRAKESMIEMARHFEIGREAALKLYQALIMPAGITQGLNAIEQAYKNIADAANAARDSVDAEHQAEMESIDTRTRKQNAKLSTQEAEAIIRNPGNADSIRRDYARMREENQLTGEQLKLDAQRRAIEQKRSVLATRPGEDITAQINQSAESTAIYRAEKKKMGATSDQELRLRTQILSKRERDELQARIESGNVTYEAEKSRLKQQVDIGKLEAEKGAMPAGEAKQGKYGNADAVRAGQEAERRLAQIQSLEQYASDAAASNRALSEAEQNAADARRKNNAELNNLASTEAQLAESTDALNSEREAVAKTYAADTAIARADAAQKAEEEKARIAKDNLHAQGKIEKLSGLKEEWSSGLKPQMQGGVGLGDLYDAARGQNMDVQERIAEYTKQMVDIAKQTLEEQKKAGIQ